MKSKRIVLTLVGLVLSGTLLSAQETPTDVTTQADCQPKVVVIPLNKCPAYLADCNGICVNTDYDTNNCGGCGRDCGAGGYCDSGSCKRDVGELCSSHNECLSGFCAGSGICNRDFYPSHPCSENSDCRSEYCNTNDYRCYDVKYVFLSSTKTTGNMGGINGGDIICQSDKGSLPGDYRAWLSDSTTSPSDWFYYGYTEFRLPQGDIVANNVPDLFDGSIDTPINQYSNGVVVTQSYTYTYTGTSNTGSATQDNCNNWTSAAIMPGTIGVIDQISPWSDVGIGPCINSEHLWCFQR